MAHGGPDCGLGAYAGVGFPAQAACEPGTPDIGVHLLLGVESVLAATEDTDPPAEPCERTQQRCGNAREGHAGSGRKSRDTEAPCAAGSETGGRSSCAEPGGRSDDAVGSTLGDCAQQCAAEWTRLPSRASAGRDRTHQGTGGIAASWNRCATGGCARSCERPHAAGSGSAECSRTTAFVIGNVAKSGKSGRGNCIGRRASAVIGVARIAWRWTARVESRRCSRTASSID